MVDPVWTVHAILSVVWLPGTAKCDAVNCSPFCCSRRTYPWERAWAAAFGAAAFSSISFSWVAWCPQMVSWPKTWSFSKNETKGRPKSVGKFDAQKKVEAFPESQGRMGFFSLPSVASNPIEAALELRKKGMAVVWPQSEGWWTAGLPRLKQTAFALPVCCQPVSVGRYLGAEI